MQKRNIILISIFMSVSMLGVIGLQGFWLKRTIDQASEQFDKRAERALYATVDALEQNEMEFIITEEFEEGIDFKTLIADADSIVDANGLGDIKFHETHDDGLATDFHIINEGNSVVYISTSDSNQFNLTQQVRYTAREVEVLEEQFEIVENEFEVIEEALRTVIVKTISKEEDVIRRLEDTDIEPLMKSELLKEGIDLPFVYAVSSDTVFTAFSSSPNLEEMLFEASIFNTSEDSPLLHLGFETRGAYILKNTSDILALVFLFTILLMGTTIYAIRFMFNQKRLADMKSDFINNMTHEFKTPLATIGLAADSIKHPRVRGNDTELDRYSNIIAKESHRLNSHVESILQLAKMERGEINLKRSSVRINDLMREALAANRMRIEQSSAEISEQYLPSEMECFVDPYHVGNALSNLIDNAIKYSKGVPQVSLLVKSEAGFISFAVKDNGIGMSEEAKKKAFEAFYREQTGNLHDVKGFGVGLSYVKEIAEKHGGLVNLESKKGKGTTVTIKIPCNEG
ncbi:MAG: HAMP domain-containing sensor histidine kinase [Bacteroidota bacterium]